MFVSETKNKEARLEYWGIKSRPMASGITVI